MPQQFWIKSRERITGPYSLDDLCKLAKESTLEPNDQISEDRSNWVRATDVPALSDQIAAREVQPRSENRFQVVLDAMCCIMIADGKVSRDELMKIRELMKRLKSPWDSEGLDRRVQEFIARVMSFGSENVLNQTCKNLSDIKDSVHHESLLKCLHLIAMADERLDIGERTTYHRIRAALGISSPHSSKGNSEGRTSAATSKLEQSRFSWLYRARASWLYRAFSRHHYSFYLAVVSATWVAFVLLGPNLPVTMPLYFFGTAALIVVNFLISMIQLIRRGRIRILINVVQLPLFCVLNYQLYRAFGQQHYDFHREPGFWDWIQLTAVHTLRAVDVLDSLEAYGIDLQNVEHSSMFAGFVLVCLHLVTGIFLLALLFKQLKGIWKRIFKRRKGESTETKFMLKLLHIVVLLSCFAGIILHGGGALGWSSVDLFTWMIDSVLRTVDIADIMQVFHLRLYSQSMDLEMTTATVVFRFLLGICVAEAIAWWRLKELEGLGMSREDLLEALSSDDVETRRQAALTLCDIDSEWVQTEEARAAVSDLASALWTKSDLRTRCRVADALGRIGPEAKGAVPHLMNALGKEKEPALRSRAAEALGRIGAEAKAALPELARAAGDLDESIAFFAGWALEQIIGASAIPELIETLRGAEYSRVCAAAVKVLGRIGPDAKAAVPQLVETLRGAEDSRVRKAAVEALGRIGPNARAAVPELVEALGTSYRKSAAKALVKIGTAAVPELINALRRWPLSYIIFTDVEGVLVEIGRPAVPEIVSALADPHHVVRREAANVLGKMGPDAKVAAPELVKALADPDDMVRHAAALALEKIGA